MARPLTRRQLDVLRAVREHQQDHGLSPTLEELGQILTINRVTVFGHVQALLQKAYLENLEPGASRGLDLTDLGRAALGLGSEVVADRTPAASPSPPSSFPRSRASFPLVGRIAAGRPMEALEEPRDLPVEAVLPDREDLYLLEVEGDSMIEDHIQSGDLVIVERERQPEDGKIVVAVLEDGEATLKRFYRRKEGGYRLQPANSSMQPMLLDQVEVRGVVTGVIRRY